VTISESNPRPQVTTAKFFAILSFKETLDSITSEFSIDSENQEKNYLTNNKLN
jgi:hypothetical protein